MAGIGIRLTAAGIAGWYRTLAKPGDRSARLDLRPGLDAALRAKAIAVWQVWQSNPPVAFRGYHTVYSAIGAEPRLVMDVLP